jgi:hypothetical protein
LLGILKTPELGQNYSQAKIKLRLAGLKLYGLAEVNNRFPKFLPTRVNFPQLKVNGGILRLKTSRFLKSFLGGIELSRGQGLEASLEKSLKIRSWPGRARRQGQPQCQQVGCQLHPQRISPLPSSGNGLG